MPAETGRIPAGQPASTAMHGAFTPEAILERPELQGVRECGTLPLPVLPVLRELLPGGGLARGSVVAVAEFGLLCLALAAGASAAGAWCGMAGLPEAGVLAAVGLGLDAERTLLVPDPGPAWPQVVASLLDGCEIVLLRPPEKATAQIRRRLEAMLRRGRGVLLVTGDWPGAQVRLRVVARRWTGLRRSSSATAVLLPTVSNGTSKHLTALPGLREKGHAEGRPETDTLTVSSHATPPQPEPPRKTRSPAKTQPSQRRSRSMAANRHDTAACALGPPRMAWSLQRHACEFLAAALACRCRAASVLAAGIPNRSVPQRIRRPLPPHPRHR